MRYLICFLLFSSFLLAVRQCKAQEVSTVPAVTHPSPEAFSMTKYGEVPIGLFTGTAQFSVPIYSIKSGSIQHNIALSYATNGTKVDEVPSRVGLGWNLKAGGVITRTIRGLPDELVNFECNSPSSHDQASSSFYSFLVNSQNSGFDSQPDEFSFSFDGYSGKFYFDGGSPKQYKYAGIKIEPVVSSLVLQTFTVTTPDGYRYFFGENAKDVSESENYFGFERPTIYDQATSAWYLTKIISPRNDTLTFQYTGVNATYLTGASQYFSTAPLFNNQFTYFANGQMTVNTFSQCSPPSEVVSNFHFQNILGVALDKIVFNHGEVRFKYSSRQDVDGEKQLDSILIIDKQNALVKAFKLGHVYAEANTSSYNTPVQSASDLQVLYPELNKRLFLTSVKELGSAYEGGGIYRFEYDSIDYLAPRISYGQDLFGYFNGKQNQYFFPNNTYVDNGILGYAEYGGDRSYNFYAVKKGCLKRVTYPTNGYTEFEYEPNLVYGYNERVITKDTLSYSIVNSTNNQTINTSQWAGTPNVTIKIDATWAGTPPDPITLQGDEGIEVALIDATASTTVWGQSVLVGNSGTFVLSAVTLTELDPNHNYYLTITANFAGLTGYVKAIRKHISLLTNQDRPLAGIRVKSISSFDSTGVVSLKKKYLYYNWGNANHSTGSILYPGVPEDNHVTVTRSMQTFNSLDYYCNFLTVLSSGVESLYLNDYGSVTYGTVIELEENGSANNGGTEHRFIVHPKGQSTIFASSWPSVVNEHVPIYIPGTPQHNTDELNGMEAFTGIFKLQSDSPVYLKKQYNFYSKDNSLFSVDTFYSVRKVISRSSYTLGVKYFYDYDVNRYTINRAWTHLDSSMTVDFAGTDSLTVKTIYAYGNLVSLEPTELKTKNSKGEALKTTFLYPNDLASGGNVYAQMVARNHLKDVVESKDYNGTTLLRTSTNTYAPWLAGNHISVSEKQMVLMNETTGNKVSFHQYDSKGNPVSVSKENDQRQSFIWDYNSSLPVAQCNNADSASIAYTSFESDGTGHWTGISSTNVQGSGGLTGDKYYQATGFNIVKSGLSSGSIYVVTYWSKNGAYSINGTQNGYPRTINSVERGGATWTLYEHQVTGQTTVSLSGSGAVDELRLYPQGALMTTFTFYPLIGMSSLCDTGNRVSYYEFDGLGRLKLIRDQNGKVIKMNDYKYASQ